MTGFDEKVGIVGLETGELKQVAVVVPQKTIHPYGRRWQALNEETTEALSQAMAKKVISGRDMSILLALIARLDIENYCNINQTQLAKHLGYKQPNVNASIKKAVKLGILIEGNKVGALKTYRINPRWVWKGNKKNLSKALKDAPHLTIFEGGKA